MRAFQASWSGTPDASHELQGHDGIILSHFYRSRPWGIDAAVDLFGCNPQLIRDPQVIHNFTLDLCREIHMRRFGDPQIVQFGDDPRVSGYTLIQLLETSNLAAHFIDQVDAACLNIFSCGAYTPLRAAALFQRWFEAQEVQLHAVF